MKIVNNDFKTQVNSFGRQLDTIITYGQNSLGRDNIFNINPNFHTNIMETLMKSVIVEADTLIPIGTRINVQSGVKVGNNYEYVNYGYYTVKEYEKDENQKSYKMKCYDDMMKTMVNYDLQVTYPITIKNLLLAICNHFGFTLNTLTFVNDDVQITTDVFSNIGYTYRDVLSELAIATCSTIEIENGVMYLKYPINTDLVINEDILNDKNVAISKKYGPVNRLVLSRISDSDIEFREDTTSIEMYGVTELKISDKQIFSTEEDRDNLIDEMWNYINDFQYYLCDLDTQGLMYVEALDKFNVSVDGVNYLTLALNDETNISDGLNEEIFNKEPEINQDNYKYTKPQDKAVKNAYIEVDKQNAKIVAVTEEVNGQNAKISVIEQTVNEINSKISDIADITTSAEDNDAQIELENINTSEPITIKIHPVNENISYLYPNSGLFPSPTTYLKIRKIRFHNNTTDENFDYILPEDLLYYDSENYDEFLLDYGDGTSETKICQVTKKCKYNSDGTVGLLATPEIHDYSNQYPTIDLTNGDYLISLLGYSTGYVFARLMASNIYTTQFATRVEMNSAIEQKANEINLVVNQKLDQSDFNSASIMLAINNDGVSSASINANKININGVISAINNNTSTTINGNKITTGTITASQVASDIITTNNFSAQTINADKITTGTLNVDRINAKSITADKIEDKGITNAKIADSTITNTQIANNTISSEKINNINADKITAGTINASNVSIINLDASNITTGTLTATAINLGNGKFKVTTSGVLTSTSGTIGGFTIGNYSLSGSTTNGTMTIQRGNNASIDFPANGGRLMLGSTATNGVALTTASKLVISDTYSHTDTGDSNASIGIRAINGNIRIASNDAIQIVPSGRFYINSHYGLTGQAGIKDSNGNTFYLAFWKGLMVGASRSAFSTSTYPWLI